MHFNLKSVNTESYDISQSIPELAYLTHNFFRYYGKFPSLLGKKIIEDYSPTKGIILDNYVGCGTSLVEAKLAGYNSIGIDINPLGVIASNVKCRSYDINRLKKYWHDLQSRIEGHLPTLLAQDGIFPNVPGKAIEESTAIANQHIPLDFPDIDKWFVEKAKNDLAIIKSCILELPEDIYREFFTLAFIAIIRRVSKAYDGEIRPHVKQKKRERNVTQAFNKKVIEMLQREAEWLLASDSKINAHAFIGDNRELSKYEIVQKHPIGLLISHPPYLNSFNYLPAFKLQLKWSEGFHEIWNNYDLADVKQLELIAWPATNQKVFATYFEDQKTILGESHSMLVNGGVCAVVIGDATMKGELIPVHKIVAEMGVDIGFKLEKILYRTTSYGVGKYAYRHRADYHNDKNGKKDGVLIFRKL